MRRRTTSSGFTLLEVMVGLALLGLALTVLLKSAAGSIFNARQAEMMGVVTELARGKMYDLEEELLKDGFSETGLDDADDECTDFEPFEDEGWPTVRWCAKIEEVQLPGWDQLQAMAQAQAGSGAEDAADGEVPGGFQDSALGGMMSMLGSFGGDNAGDIDAQMGASFVQSQYQMVQDVLRDSIRKVTLFLEWEVLGEKRTLKVVAFFTDAAAMDKTLQGLGSQPLSGGGGSGGGGSGGGGSGGGGSGGGGSGGGGSGGGGSRGGGSGGGSRR